MADFIKKFGGRIILLLIAAVTSLSLLVMPTDQQKPAQATAAGLTKPNIVLVMTDDQTLESVSRMPYISSRSDWISFDQEFFNVSLCCPSRATMLSGQYSHRHKVETNTSGAKFNESATLATWLQAAGYKTAYIGKYLNLYPFDRGPYVPPGWNNWRVFDGVGYYDYSLNENGTVNSYGSAETDYSTDVLASKANLFINKQTGPFFMVLAPNAPHRPRTPALRHSLAFTGEVMPKSPNFNEADVSDKPAWVQGLPLQDVTAMNKERRNQYRTNLAVDEMVRGVFDTLESKGILDNTVVIFMTDNGYSLGEHRYVRKRCAYEECIRTPMLVHYPGQSARKVNDLVQNVDIASTIAELAGASPTISQDGRSLVPLLTNTAPPAPWRTNLLLRWIGGYEGTRNAADDYYVPAYWGVRTAQYKYLELETGEKELYDLQADPYEMTNQAGNPSYDRIEADLANQLTHLKSQ